MKNLDSNTANDRIEYHDPSFKRGYSVQGTVYMYVSEDRENEIKDIEGFYENSYVTGSGCCFVSTKWLFDNTEGRNEDKH